MYASTKTDKLQAQSFRSILEVFKTSTYCFVLAQTQLGFSIICFHQRALCEDKVELYVTVNQEQSMLIGPNDHDDDCDNLPVEDTIASFPGSQCSNPGGYTYWDTCECFFQTSFIPERPGI